jgi:hypothetical protein
MEMILSLQKLAHESNDALAGSGVSWRCSTTSNAACTNDEEVG